MSFSVLKIVLLSSIEEADEGEWSIDEAMKKLQSPEEGNLWKVTFKEGVDLDEKLLEGASYEKASEDFIARYDLTYVTPCWHEIRCKVTAYTLFNCGLIYNARCKTLASSPWLMKILLYTVSQKSNGLSLNQILNKNKINMMVAVYVKILRMKGVGIIKKG